MLETLAGQALAGATATARRRRTALARNAEPMATQLDSGPPDSARPTGTVTFLFTDIEGKHRALGT